MDHTRYIFSLYRFIFSGPLNGYTTSSLQKPSTGEPLNHNRERKLYFLFLLQNALAFSIYPVSFVSDELAEEREKIVKICAWGGGGNLNGKRKKNKLDRFTVYHNLVRNIKLSSFERLDFNGT